MVPEPDDGVATADADDDDEWRFSLSDLEDDEDEPDEENLGDDEDDSGEEDDDRIDAGVAGTLDVDEELEAGKIDPENALFVIVGVVLALVFVAGFLNMFP